MNCTVCSRKAAEFLCLCHWPVDQFFCKTDISIHIVRPGSVHRPMPITVLKTLTSREQFELLLLRWTRFDTVKTNLTQYQERINDLREMNPEESAGELQGLGEGNRLKLETFTRGLAGQVSMAIQEITAVLENQNHQIRDVLAASCWEFISGQTASFEPKFAQESEMEIFLAGLRHSTKEQSQGQHVQSVDKTRIALLPAREQEGAEEARQLRRASQAAKWEKCKSQCAKLLRYLEKQFCWPLLKTGKWQRPSLCQLFWSLPLFSWPIVGFCQSMEYVKSNGHGCDPKGVFICLLPTFCICFGATFNRSWLRGAFDRETARDLFLFSLHVWNAFLVDVELGTTECPKFLCCCMWTAVEKSIKVQGEINSHPPA